MTMPLSLEEKQECIKLAARPNGSINVSRLFRLMEVKAAFRFIRQHPELADQLCDDES
jgi:hypothetical protein